MSTPIYGAMGFRGTPLMVLPRTKTMRVLLVIAVLPAAVLCGWGAVASLMPPEPEVVGGALLATLAFALLALFAWAFLRESRRATRLFEEGIEQSGAATTKILRWTDVESIRFRSVKVNAGGIIGIAVRAAMERAITPRQGANFDERLSNLTVRISGQGTTIKLTSNDKGSGPALDEALRRVNPRLIEDSLRRIQGADTVRFGKIALTSSGISIGRSKPVPFSDVERIYVQNGKILMKRRGKWLSTGLPIGSVPNAFVLLAAWARLSGSADESKASQAMTETGIVV